MIGTLCPFASFSEGHSSSDKASTQVSRQEVEEKKDFVRQQRFDVFLSYAVEDQEFAEEVRDRLMNDVKVKVFVPVEGKLTNCTPCYPCTSEYSLHCPVFCKEALSSTYCFSCR